MHRRTLLLTLAGGVVAPALPVLGSAAFAQAVVTDSEVPAGGLSDEEYRRMTLAAGSFARQASELALLKARSLRVKEFAKFEVDEQATLAAVHADPAAATPAPALDESRATALKSLQSATTGPAFEKAYVAGQIQGHRELLLIQENYLKGGGGNRPLRHVAMLAAATIRMHLALLSGIQSPARV